MYKRFFKFKITKNSKCPLKGLSWNEKANWETNEVDLSKYNYGILCGKVNNLIVIDLDLEKKRDNGNIIPSGYVKMKEYIDEYDDFDTFTVKTPSGGIHYYFLYESKNKSTNILIEQIPNATEFYGHGIDVRTEKKTGGAGGYVVGPESEINGKKYTVINDKPIIEMPENLAFWLLQGLSDNSKSTSKTKTRTRTNVTKKLIIDPKYKYDTTIEYVEKILNELPVEWVENRDKWLKVLTCLKNLNIDGNEELFYKFCEKSSREKHKTNTSKLKNKEEWDKNNCQIDFNYIICEVNRINKTNYPFIQKYVPIKNEIEFKNQIKTNHKYLEKCYDYNVFNEHDVIVIQSTTGTGKTKDTAEKFKKYCKENDNDKQLISIVGLIATADQHIKSFEKEGIKLFDYKTCDKNELNKNLVICINSLLKLSFLSEEQIKDKIIYIDEFECFINILTHNKNLDNNIRLINNLLMKIIKNCHKLIITDALINQNVKNFLNCISNKKIIFIKNEFKKYQGVKAVRYHNENDFLNQVKEDIKNNNYFLFGSDSCSKITQYFDETLKQRYDDNDDKVITELFNKITDGIDDKQKDKFLLITSKTAYKIKDANTEFKDKFVFYSPSIVNSVDFSSDFSQNQYLYFNSLTINSQSMFQQGTRTRNIKTLKFYANQRQHNYKYENLEDVELINKKINNSDDKIKKVCLNFDEDDNEKIIENTFFKMWCYNEYINDCYNTNKICHFQNILTNEGFVLSHEGRDLQLSKNKVKEMKMTTTQNEIDKYNKFVEEYKKDLETNDDIESDMSESEFNKKISNFRNNKQYEKYMERIDLLNLKIDELPIDKLGYLVYNEFDLNSYFNILKLFKTDAYIKNNLDELKKTSYDIKIVNNIYNKITLLRKFESFFKIIPFDLNFELTNDKLIDKFSDDEFINYKKAFRSEKNKPKNINELRSFYVQMIENIISKNITVKKKVMENNIRFFKYEFDKNLIKSYYELSIRKNNYNDYDYNLLKSFDITKPNNYEKYYFN